MQRAYKKAVLTWCVHQKSAILVFQHAVKASHSDVHSGNPTGTIQSHLCTFIATEFNEKEGNSDGFIPYITFLFV